MFITEEDEITEVTSYAITSIPDDVPVSSTMAKQCKDAKRRVQAKPEVVTSHTVLVVDHSGSMKQSDIWGFRCRFVAVYVTLASTLIAKRLRAAGTGHDLAAEPTDVISIIAMGEDAELIVDFEPVSWVLHNKLLEYARNWKDNARFDGNYLPALYKAQKQLSKGKANGYALMMFFLSDGGPSDKSKVTLDFSIEQFMTKMASKHGDRLTVGTIGFGSEDQRKSGFRTLERMAEAARESGAGRSVFLRSEKSSHLLTSHISTLLSSLSATRSVLDENSPMTIRRIGTENESDDQQSNGWHVFKDRCERWLFSVQESGWVDTSNWDRNGNWVKTNERKHLWKGWEKADFSHPKATGLAVRWKSFASGAERVVFSACEVDEKLRRTGVPLVAKETKFLENLLKENEFHTSFCMTQKVAANLANKFNEKLDQKFHQLAPLLESEACKPWIISRKGMMPRIEFVSCSVYWPCWVGEEKHAFLVEPKLAGKYNKWNDNAGGVGSGSIATMRESCVAQGMVAIQEDSDDTDDEMNVDDKGSNQIQYASIETIVASLRGISADDVPQAFTHFTHEFTKGKKMVCDLQGVLDKHVSPPLFRLTDPCIHYQSTRKRRGVFGRTDRGAKGMTDFFKSHTCNNVCRLLGLPPNKKRT